MTTDNALELIRARRSLKSAQKRYDTLYSQRVELDEEITRLHQEVRALDRSTRAEAESAKRKVLLSDLRRSRKGLAERTKVARNRLLERKREVKLLQRKLNSWERSSKRYQKAWEQWYEKQTGHPHFLNGSQLKAARCLLGWSRSELAARLTVKEPLLARYEKSTDSIPDDKFCKSAIKLLARYGVELVQPGFYIGDGGPGVRIRKNRRPVANAIASAKTKKRTSRKINRGKSAA